MTFQQPSDDRAGHILFRALDHAAEDREAYLAEACDGDEALLSELRALLAAHESAPSGFLESPCALRLDSDALTERTNYVSGVSDDNTENPATSANPDAPVPFIFGQRIAQGGMGAILEADDCRLGRKIAVKVMLDESSVDDGQRLRFVQEAAVLGQLEHPNIVPVHDLGRDAAGSLYYSMKLVKGRTLQDVLNDLRAEDPGALAHYTLDRLLTIFRKACDAIAFAHAENIIHRDLKPENIMVGEFGEVLVMDWGLSKILNSTTDIASPAALDPNLDASVSVSATLEGSVMGTPQYMSPEQAAGEIREMDPRSDIYSLGGILYAILTLRPPVVGKDVYEVLAKVQAGDLTSPTDFGAPTPPRKGEVLEAKKIKPLPHIEGGKIPPALSAVTMKALSLKKEQRYQNVGSLGEDIEKWQSGFATSAEEAGFGTQLKLLIKRNQGIFTTGIAAWLLITALAVWFVISLQGKERRAVAEAERATNAEALAVQEKQIARAALAESSLLLADSALRENDFQLMQDSLDAVPKDLRDGTWRYLSDQTDTSILKIDGWVRSIVGHPTAPGVFAITTSGGMIRLVHVKSGKTLLGFRAALMPHQIAFSPDGKTIAVSGQNDEVGLAIHRVADGKLLKKWAAPIAGDDLEFSEDGSLLVQTAREDTGKPSKWIYLWEVANGQLRWKTHFDREEQISVEFVPGTDWIFYFARSFSGRKSHFLSVRDGSIEESFSWGKLHASAVSADGNLIVNRSVDGTIRGHLVRERQTIFTVNMGESHGRFLEFTPNQKHFVIQVARKNRPDALELRDSTTGALRRSFSGIKGKYYSLSVHPLTSEIAVGGTKTRVWEGETPATWEILNKDNHTGTFWGDDDLFIGPVSETVYALQRLTIPGATEVIHPFKWHERVRCSVSPDGRHAFLTVPAGKERYRLLKNPGTDPEVVAASQGPTNFFLNTSRLDPSGERVFVSDGSKSFILDAKTGMVICDFSREQSQINQADWILGGQQVLTLGTLNQQSVGYSTAEHRIVVRDSATGDVVTTRSHHTAMDALAVSPDGDRFAEAGTDKNVRIRSVETLEILQEFRAHNDAITILAWHPTLPVVASASEDFTVKIWNLDTGELLQVLRTLHSSPTALSFSPTGKRITCTDNRTIRIWDLISAKDPRLPVMTAQVGETKAEAATNIP